MVDRATRIEALDALLTARMQHTRWVAEVMHSLFPDVAEDHTQCDFGRWLIDAETKLGEIAEFRAMHATHKDLHDTFKILRRNPTHNALREEIQLLSDKLIEQLDALEHWLNQREAS